MANPAPDGGPGGMSDEPLIARKGKVAALPYATREELCRRLRDGARGPALLAWLNGLPETRALCARDYEGVEVSPENLSQWRLGGYRDWLDKREEIERKRELAAYCAELGASGKDIFAGGAAIAGGKLMEVLEEVDVADQVALLSDKPDSLAGLLLAFAKMREADARDRKVALDDRKLGQNERKLDLEERKFRDRFVAEFIKFYDDRQAREIMAGKTEKTVKMDELRQLFFGARPQFTPPEIIGA